MTYESLLAASRVRSSVTRTFDMLANPMIREDYYQLTFALVPQSGGEPRAEPEECDHVGTSRESQDRLLGSGFDTICSGCGRITW